VPFVNGCDESLPPRESPPEIFSMIVRADYDYYPRGLQARNQIKYNIVLKNIYDETIQDTLDFQLNARLEWFGGPVTINDTVTQNVKTVTVGRSAITYMKKYNPSTGIVTIDPGDSLVLEYSWNFVNDDSVLLLQYFPVKFISGEGGCVISQIQTIGLMGSVRVLKSRASLIIRPYHYSRCFFIKDGDPPCSNYIWNPCK
jgi:hypothetical protein